MYDRALELAPKYVQVLNNKGTGLQNLGDLLAEQSQKQDAKSNYIAAIDTYDKALLLTSDDKRILQNREYALEKLRNL